MHVASAISTYATVSKLVRPAPQMRGAQHVVQNNEVAHDKNIKQHQSEKSHKEKPFIDYQNEAITDATQNDFSALLDTEAFRHRTTGKKTAHKQIDTAVAAYRENGELLETNYVSKVMGVDIYV